jgi:hypothetical protein
MNQKAENLENTSVKSDWKATSWQSRQAKQQASYPDLA